jgi:Type IV secretory pathway, VirB9 components
MKKVPGAILFAVSLITVFFFFSCKTVDLEPRNAVGIGTVPQVMDLPKSDPLLDELRSSIEVQKQIVYVERPVYIPGNDATEEIKETGLDSVKKSTEEGTIKPSDYSHAARVYDYDVDQVYEVYCQVLRTTDIYLEPGEVVIDSPFVSDSERWIIGAGVNEQNGTVVQHIYIKPKQSGLDASLIINTSARVYHCVLRSYNTVYMPIVKWKYRNEGFPQKYAKDHITEEITTEMEKVDPRFLTFDYKIVYNIFRKPRWIPKRVYDDGKKTYIEFDEQTLQMEQPGIFEKKSDVVNYRIKGSLVVIDKLIEKVTIKYNKQKIAIEKKRTKR